MNIVPTVWFTHAIRPAHHALLASVSWKWETFPFLSPRFYSVEIPQTDIPWVVTSQTAVQWLSQQSENDLQKIKTEVPRWYVIGNATFDALQQLGISAETPPNDEQGTALGLQLFEEGNHACVHLTGVHHRDELGATLRSYHIDYHLLEVYSMEKTTHRLSFDQQPNALCFMSPRTIDAYVESGNDTQLSPEITLFAIGATTQNHIETIFSRSAVTPPKASFASLIETITHYFSPTSHVNFS